MSCNSCAKSFSLLRQEKGCPGCGFSYCSKCLNNKVFLEKLKCEAKVCTKCKNNQNRDEPKILPPDAYYKRIGATDEASISEVSSNPIEQEIHNRLKKLKEAPEDAPKCSSSSNQDIIGRLQKLKGDIPSTSDAELEARLANIKGVPISAVQSKPILPKPDTRTEQQQADDLLEQYMQQANIDNTYKDEFDNLVSDIESRLQKLKGSTKNVPNETKTTDHEDSEDEEETVKKILAKVKAETALEGNEICEPVLDELPFCEICNEDANMRCLGCKYLFCKQCFVEHKDDDDGCNKYEPYTALKNVIY